MNNVNLYKRLKLLYSKMIIPDIYVQLLIQSIYCKITHFRGGLIFTLHISSVAQI